MKRIYLLIILISFLKNSTFVFAQVIIMPLGDSITKGATGSSLQIGYRQKLYNYLTNIPLSLSVNFVGFNVLGSTSNYNHFEGYPGWEAIQHSSDVDFNRFDMLSHLQSDFTNYSDELSTKLTHYNPDIALLHIGTNNLESGWSPTEASNNVNTVLSTIYSTAYNNNSTNTVVFLAKIILDDNDNQGVNGPNATRTKNYNKNLLTMAVNRIVNNNDKLVVVNMQDALIYPDAGTTLPPAGSRVGTTDIFYDNSTPPTFLHPYQTGYDKMAGVWYRAIKNYYNSVPTPIAPDSAIANVSFPDTLAWGVIVNPSTTSPYIYQVSKSSSFSSQIYNSTTSNRYFILNDPTQFLSATTYYWRAKGSSDGINFSNSNTWTFTTSPLYVDATVILQGPYITNSTNPPYMNTTLNSGGYLQANATNQPYSGFPWSYTGTESVSTDATFFAGHPTIVDWVLIQLRSGNSASEATTVIAQRAAFLLSSGKIVDLDGSSPVSFRGITYGDNSGIPFGNYYIVVEHRNHLGIISNSKVALTNNTLTYDFTGGDVLGGTEAIADLKGDGTLYGMWAGDGNANGTITAFDNNSVWLPQFLNGIDGYWSGDYNLNGAVTAFDSNSMWLPNFISGRSSAVPPNL